MTRSSWIKSCQGRTGGTPQEDKYPTTGFSLFRSKPDLAPLPRMLSFLALSPLEAETFKMNATLRRWKSCFYTIVDVYTGDSTWGGSRLLGRVVGLVLICFVGGLCSIAYEQLWAVFDKLPCLDIGLALKGLVLWTKSVTMFAASVCLSAPSASLEAQCLV